jgi:hypothetical protein
MTVTCGFVRNGQVVPNMPLEEGSFVRIEVIHGPLAIDPEIQEELDFWMNAGGASIEELERKLDEEDDDAPR